ncbi:MAG: DUF3108 domain-containing protein [Pseudobdellovibrionaceae bacterium]|jgi:hypothetical protein
MALIVGCASKVLKFDEEEKLKDLKEFDQTVNIVMPPEETASFVAPSTTTSTLPGRSGVKPKISPQKPEMKKTTTVTTPAKRQPEIESDRGFQGRRPIVDPFQVGEKIVHEVTYFKTNAGSLTFEVKPFASVNGRKAYNFKTSIQTSPFYSRFFYSVDDYVNVLMDFEDLVPSVYTLHVRESSQLREARMFIDHQKHQATFWEKKVTEKKGVEEKKLEWSVESYAQNVFSTMFYLRFFQWEVGSENAFRVAHDGKNLIFKGKALRKENLKTEVGTFDAIVIKPEVTLEGKFKPTGENLIWVSDDSHRYILKIESEIKIGTLVSRIVELNPGTPNRQ